MGQVSRFDCLPLAQTMPATEKVFSAYLFSFPFWLFVDTRNPPALAMAKIGTTELRVYPPFRSAPANAMPMPAIRTSAVPFLEGRRPKHINNENQSTLICLATMPQLAIPNLQSAGNTLVWGATWEQDKVPVAFPMDSLRVDLLAADTSKPDIHPNDFARCLIANLRGICRQWWLSASTDPLLGWLRNEFPIDRFGKPTGELMAGGKARVPRGTERPINASMWQKAISLSEKGVVPPLSDQLLLDAEYFAASGDFRRFVLDAAAACEIAKDEAVERLWAKHKTAPFRRGKALTGYDLGKHLDAQMRDICGRSLRDDNPIVFRKIQLLWDARGNVAHGEDAFYRDDSAVIKVSDEIAYELLVAAELCVQWINAL